MFHLLRAVELDRQLRAGVAYPRWAPDFYLGYGYPIFLFTPLLPYYLVEMVHLFGTSFSQAMGAVEAGALFASGLLCFNWLRRLLSPVASACGAVLYALAPYHLVNLYFRGDLAEFVAAAWFPAILLALWAMLERPAVWRLVLLASSVAALLLTHLVSALLFLPCVAAIALVSVALTYSRRPLARLGAAAGAAALGLALAAFAWLPAVAGVPYATFAKLLRFYNFEDNFATVSQLFSHQLLQAYGYIFAGGKQYGYQFGAIQSLAAVAGLLVLPFGWRRLRPSSRGAVAVLIIVLPIALLGCLRLSAPIWTRLPALQLVQFPWRLLAVAALPVALLASLAVDAIPSRLRRGVGLAVCIATSASSLVLLHPLRMAVPASYATATGIAQFELLYHLAGTSAAAEYLPPTVKTRQTVSAVASKAATGYAPPEDPAATTPAWDPTEGRQRYTFDTSSPGEVVLPVLDFPGWTATIDSNPTTIQPAEDSGLVTLQLPAGRHTVALVFGATKIVRVADLVSAAAVLLAIFLIVAFRLQRPQQAGVSAREPVPPSSVKKRLVRAWPQRYTVAVPTVVLILVSLAVGLLGSRATHSAWQSLDVSFPGGLTLQGYLLSPPSNGGSGAAVVSPGDALTLRVEGSAPTGTHLAVRLTNAAGTDWADWESALTSPVTEMTLRVPAAQPPGLYELRLGSLQPGGPPDFSIARAGMVRLLPVDGFVAIGPLIIMPDAALQPTTAAVAGPGIGSAPQAPIGQPLIIWPNRAGLSQVALPAQVSAGSSLAITWTWMANPRWRGTERLVEAIHLTDARGHVVAAANTEPADGYFPTPFWLPGQRVADRPSLLVPADVPPGEYDLSVGLMDGDRALPAQDAAGEPAGDDAVVGRVSVTPPTTAAPWTGPSQQIGQLAVQLAEPLTTAVPGSSWHIALEWHSTDRLGADYVARVELRQGGQVVGATEAPIGGARYPTSRWRPGETERQELDIPISGTAAAGPAELTIVLSEHGTPTGQIAIGKVTIAGRAHVFTARPTIIHLAQFGDGISLQGYDLLADGAPAIGGTPQARRTLEATLYWKAVGPTPAPLKVTVQLLDAGNRLVAQRDSEPGAGAAPTTSWVAGEIVQSRHQLAISGLAPGTYHLITALYDPASGQRISSPRGDTETLTDVVVP